MAGIELNAAVVTTFNEDIERACKGHLPKEVIEILCRISEQQANLEFMYNQQNDVLLRQFEATKVMVGMGDKFRKEIARINKSISHNGVTNEQIGEGDG